MHGRADTLVPPAFTSRPYFGLNKIVEGAASKLSYIEVTNAQHFDAFIDNAALPGYDSMFVPLHYYFIQAMDRMYAHLTTGAALPPSQVVRTTPRGGTPGQAPQITTANVPAIAQTPAAANLITFSEQHGRDPGLGLEPPRDIRRTRRSRSGSCATAPCRRERTEVQCDGHRPGGRRFASHRRTP